ncbi:hypothetical protein B488_05150 [Liberibacter crescens BT-1]|uniref:Uncharacterized protein n=1 Tax=Liberibacter crescens (strain BT-1) TaxID=1215343 RepID=L0EU93_LIBCB|nr:hypothetical protein [Liberibacter crescens]AGA64507.1 hypothetical protein B488_05150 [Liberibacter crescens BT-1]AMC12662.1 hypothetical protein RL73_02670 [Liberibacter crescens]
MKRMIWGGERAPEINHAIAHFVMERVPACAGGWERFTSMGIVNDDVLVAGVIYHNYCPLAQVIELSGASDDRRWLNRFILQAIYHYPWDELQCQAVVHRVPDDDQQHRWLPLLGGVRYRIPRLRGRNAAENIYVITREAWMNNKFNKEKVNGKASTKTA